MPDPLLGSTTGGCEILEVIGQGGMGIIYRARQKSLDRIVALKILSPKYADDISFVVRFQREARSIARVNHQNILAVYDVGSEGNTHYMIMELIDGESLSEIQNRAGGPLNLEEACDYIRQACQGLEAAQVAGVTHRDIKPENLMVTRKGVLKVSDFGLAKEASTSATSTDAVMGTPAFMSPEQCDGKKVDGRTDIYSLGATFYKLITGRLPFEAETAMSMMYRHKHEALVPPTEIVPSIPAAISAVIERMMAKKREKRFQTMSEVLAALDAAEHPPLEVKSAPPTRLPVEHPAQGQGSGRMPVFGVEENPRVGGGTARPVPGARPPSRSYEAPPPGVTGRMPSTGRHPSERMPAVGLGSLPRFGSSSEQAAVILDHGAPRSGHALLARGDEALANGDRANAIKHFRDALRTDDLDPALRQRAEQEIRKELSLRQKAAQEYLQRGLLVEASREFRMALSIDPENEGLREHLKDIEKKLASKRSIVNDIRTAIASLQFEQAVQLWDRTPQDLRDEALARQLEHLRTVVVPSLKLCEKGEQYDQQGRLEEALAGFQEALQLDENCERARQGMADTGRKLHRIEVMMKEGYEYSLRQDFERAIELWKPILKLRPGHTQAIKSIVEAYLTQAQEKRSQGDLKSALRAYSKAHETDPQNPSVKRQFEEMVELHDKEQALLGRAKDATACNRVGEAIRYWDEIVRINPHSKQAGPAIKELRTARGKSWARIALLVTFAAAAGGTAYQYALEYAAFNKANAFMQSEAYDEAFQVLDQSGFLFRREEARILKSQAERGYLVCIARLKVAENDTLNAAEFYQQAAQLAANTSEEGALLLESKLLYAQAQLAAGEAAILKHDWATALGHFGKCKSYADVLREQPHLFTQANASKKKTLVEQAERAHKATLFIAELQAGERFLKEGRKAEALASLKRAQDLKPDNPQVRELLKSSLGYDPESYRTAINRAAKALSEPWRTEAIREAASALDLAAQADPDQHRLTLLRGYLADMQKCETKGMALVNFDDPLDENMAWDQEDRRKAFCIDRFEYPNRKGQLPQAASWLEAKSLCEKEQKQLCGLKRWQEACKAKEFGGIWTFGKSLDRNACNWAARGPRASGELGACHNSIGAFDMSGNLAEWTLDGPDDQSNQHYQAGGSFASDPDNARCLDKTSAAQDEKSPLTGFRCCAPLEP